MPRWNTAKIKLSSGKHYYRSTKAAERLVELGLGELVSKKPFVIRLIHLELIGHPVLNPEGKVIRIPAYSLEPLKKLKVLVRNKETGLYQLTPRIYRFLKPEFDPLTSKAGKPGLRQLLGPDCSGPKDVDCDCEKCSLLKDLDEQKSASPKETVHNRFRAYVKR